VGEVRIKFVDGQHEDIDPKKLVLIDPDFVASRKELLNLLQDFIKAIDLTVDTEGSLSKKHLSIQSMLTYQKAKTILSAINHEG
jgi:hypothetical protein